MNTHTKAKLFSSAVTVALVLAGCNTAAPTLSEAPATAAEQAFMASTATTPRYNVMLATVNGAVDTSTGVHSDVLGSTVDVGATTTVTTGTTVGSTTGASVGANASLETSAMLAHAAMVKLATKSCVASSTRAGSWFQASNLTDGNLHSAWAAGDNDANPMLTIELNACTTVRALGLKQSGGATFDVAVSTNGGAYTVIGTNLSSTATLLDWVDLKATQADKVQLRFHNASKLLVCEVQAFGDACGAQPSTAPSVKPSTMPSSMPSTTPSTMPSTTPSSMPSTTPSVMPSTAPSTIPSTMPSTAPSTPAEGGGGGGVQATGECDVVDVDTHHHFRLDCDVRHHNRGNDEGACQLVDLDTHIVLKGHVEHCSFVGAAANCSGHLDSGESFSFKLAGNLHRTCSFHGAGVDFDDQACSDVAGHGLSVKLVSDVSAWLNLVNIDFSKKGDEHDDNKKHEHEGHDD